MYKMTRIQLPSATSVSRDVALKNTSWGVLIGIVLLPAMSWGASFGGIYNGNFTGGNNGKFAAFIRADNSTVLLAYNATQNSGYKNTSIVINADGSFSAMDGDTGLKAGKPIAINYWQSFPISSIGLYLSFVHPDNHLHMMNRTAIFSDSYMVRPALQGLKFLAERSVAHIYPAFA